MPATRLLGACIRRGCRSGARRHTGQPRPPCPAGRSPRVGRSPRIPDQRPDRLIGRTERAVSVFDMEYRAGTTNRTSCPPPLIVLGGHFTVSVGGVDECVPIVAPLNA